MEYVIKIDTKYIGYNNSGKYSEVSDINMAIRGSMHRLTDIVNNSVAPNLRSKCKIVQFNLTNTMPVVSSSPIISNSKSRFDVVMEQLKSIDFTDFDREFNKLKQQQSLIDQEITDIQHYIEFNKLNAAEGYKVYKMLQDKLLQRRVIKDDLRKFQMLSDIKVSDIYNGNLDKSIEEMSDRTYTPRRLTHLFKGD